MNVEVLDIIYGAFIVLLHATAESGVTVLSLASKVPFLRRLYGESTLKPYEGGAGRE